MKISGFSFIKNGDKLYIPTKEAIMSILPICDEFVIAVGDSDPDDKTLDIINSINSDKIKIIHSIWDTKAFPKNTEFARQTDLAKENCTGDWLFYIQCDEAVHEDDLPLIKKACKDNLNNKGVDGFLFKYYHFWGDYKHYHKSHAWYNREIRLIRNDAKIHSWKDAQSFRKFENWSGTFNDYQRKEGSEKLKVKLIDAHIYHYGYVRPPSMMTVKENSSSKSYHGDKSDKMNRNYDYGPLNKIESFKGTHPLVMTDWMTKFNWQDELQHQGSPDPNREKWRHEKIKYRLLSKIENTFLGGNPIGGFRNYIIIK